MLPSAEMEPMSTLSADASGTWVDIAPLRFKRPRRERARVCLKSRVRPPHRRFPAGKNPTLSLEGGVVSSAAGEQAVLDGKKADANETTEWHEGS